MKTKSGDTILRNERYVVYVTNNDSRSSENGRYGSKKEALKNAYIPVAQRKDFDFMSVEVYDQKEEKIIFSEKLKT